MSGPDVRPGPPDRDAPYRAVFEHARDAMLLADEDARYVDVNPAACALLGYSREELLTLTIWDVTPDAAREDHRVRGARDG